MQDKGVYVNLHGFPDFTPYARVLVELPPDLPVGADGVALRGDALREKDIAACDNLLKEMYKNDPELFAALQDSHTWHHLEGARHLILIPTEVHEAVRHYGGVATANSAGTGTVASPADSRGEPPAPAGSDAESEPPTPPSSVESLTRTPRPGEWSPSKLKDNHQQGDATYTGPIHGTPIAVPPDFVRTAGDTDGI
nr:HNH endonuclease [Actinocatenispora thailandica]